MVDGADTPQKSDTTALNADGRRFPFRMWVLSLGICALVVAVAFTCWDIPIAHKVYGILGTTAGIARGLGSAVLLGIEGAVALGLVIVRIRRGYLSPFREATALACLTSICAYAINDTTLKLFFGVPNPGAVLHGAAHAFNLMKGSASSSFPSGHMAIAGAFAGVFFRLYRTTVFPLSLLLLAGAALLVVGDWHFVSDVIAGTFVGVTAGLLAGELWLAHSSRSAR